MDAIRLLWRPSWNLQGMKRRLLPRSLLQQRALLWTQKILQSHKAQLRLIATRKMRWMSQYDNVALPPLQFPLSKRKSRLHIHQYLKWRLLPQKHRVQHQEEDKILLHLLEAMPSHTSTVARAATTAVQLPNREGLGGEYRALWIDERVANNEAVQVKPISVVFLLKQQQKSPIHTTSCSYLDHRVERLPTIGNKQTSNNHVSMYSNVRPLVVSCEHQVSLQVWDVALNLSAIVIKVTKTYILSEKLTFLGRSHASKLIKVSFSHQNTFTTRTLFFFAVPIIFSRRDENSPLQWYNTADLLN